MVVGYLLLRDQRIVLLIALVSLLAKAGVHVLAAVFGIFSGFGKIGVAAFDARIFGTVWKLSFERGLAVLIAVLALDSAFFQVIVLVRHV